MSLLSTCVILGSVVERQKQQWRASTKLASWRSRLTFYIALCITVLTLCVRCCLKSKQLKALVRTLYILHTNGHSNFIYPLFILSFKITCLSTFANFCMFRLKREDLNLHWVVVGRGTRNSGFGNSTHKQISIWSGYTFCLFVKYIFRYHCFIPFEAFSIPSRPSPHPHDIIRSLCPSVSHSCSEERSRSSKSSFGSVKYRREPEGLKITTIRNDLELKY